MGRKFRVKENVCQGIVDYRIDEELFVGDDWKECFSDILYKGDVYEVMNDHIMNEFEFDEDGEMIEPELTCIKGKHTNELDVVSNEVYSKVVNEVNDKCLKIVNENVDFSLLEELREIELKKEKLESELSDFVNKVNDEFNIRISYNSVGRYGYKENKSLFNIVGSVDYNCKRNIEKELILGGIDKGLDIKELINNMVKEFVSKEFKS